MEKVNDSMSNTYSGITAAGHYSFIGEKQGNGTVITKEYVNNVAYLIYYTYWLSITSILAMLATVSI